MNLVALGMVRLQFSQLGHNIATTAQHGDLAMALQKLFSAVQLLLEAQQLQRVAHAAAEEPHKRFPPLFILRRIVDAVE